MRHRVITPLACLLFLLLLNSGVQAQGVQPGQGRAAKAEKAKVTIVDFNPVVNGVAPGYGPNCYVQPDGEWCYGAAYLGGQGSMYGSLYKVRPDGSGLETIYSFDIVHGWAPGPSPVLDPSGTRLYGTTSQGGQNGIGVVYAFSLADRKMSTLATFAGPSGSCSWSHMLLGNTLYGLAGQGGAHGYGTIWAVDASGSSTLKVLHDFSGGPSDVATAFSTPLTYNPRDGLLYGMAFTAGTNGLGGIFSIRPDGSEYRLRASFSEATGDRPQLGELALDPSTELLYGAGWMGGQNNLGTLFVFNPADDTITPLLSLTEQTGTKPYSAPAISKSGRWIYMVTWQGGSDDVTPVGRGYGTILVIKKDGSDWRVLYQFTKKSGGLSWATPELNQDGSRLIATTVVGGKYGVGTLVSLEIPAQFQ